MQRHIFDNLSIRTASPRTTRLLWLLSLVVGSLSSIHAANETPVCMMCPGASSYADVVLDYDPGCFIRDPSPEGALGAPDYNPAFPFNVNRIAFLGDGGALKLGFTDNALANSGDTADDLFIFEVGGAIEACDIAIKPKDATTRQALITAGVLDPDGDDYFDIGRIDAGISSFDIDALVPGFGIGELQFDAVEIRDVADRGCQGLTPGADIDAICALTVLPPDCAGTPGGLAVLDTCGVCLEPSDPAFGQSCVDCAGVPFGTALIDSCGICLEPTSPVFNDFCKDCEGTINGTAVLDDCGVCLQPNDPAFNQSCTDCAGIVNGTAILDDCGACLQPGDPAFNQSCTDCAGVVNGTAILDDCGVCLQPNSPAFNQSCTDCAGVVNGTSIVDDCGVCLQPSDPAFNQSCTDCAGIVNGTAILDDCGVCLQPNDPSFNESCTDCAGIVNGTAILDDCGICLQPNDPSFNESCTDCAGIINGTAILDDCGVCLQPNDPSFNESCTDCAGVVNGTAILDDCGVCQQPTAVSFNESCRDCAGVVNGLAIIDSCGNCLTPNDPKFNATCLDCAGVINGISVLDSCGICLMPSDPTFGLSCLGDLELYLPTAFSPNGDGVNDKFEVFAGSGVPGRIKEMRMFDRWGNEVYRQFNLSIDRNSPWWEGDFKGKPLDMGYYIYYLVAIDNQGVERIWKGEVMLVR